MFNFSNMYSNARIDDRKLNNMIDMCKQPGIISMILGFMMRLEKANLG